MELLNSAVVAGCNLSGERFGDPHAPADCDDDQSAGFRERRYLLVRGQRGIGLIGVVSSVTDLRKIAAITHLVWAHLRTRVWVEWIDSGSNISDGISRRGHAATLTADAGIVVHDVTGFPLEQMLAVDVTDGVFVVKAWMDAGTFG